MAKDIKDFPKMSSSSSAYNNNMSDSFSRMNMDNEAAMLPTATLTNNDFEQFIKYYNEFEAKYRDSPYAGHEAESECYMTFGVTGAGKSTTIARLLSNATPEDFLAELSSGSDDNAHLVRIEDVVISGAPTATTIIPRVYTVPGANRQLHLCDMPGLRDNDGFKQIVIDVLYKCFLTRVQRTRYLIIVQMSKYRDMADVRSLLADYHDYLLKMFGKDNYLTAIDNFYFVFTHPDKRTINDIDKYFTEALVWLARFGSPAPTAEENRFLARILRSKIVVDLKVDTNRTVLQNLQAIITQDETTREGRFVPTSQQHIVSLRAGEDKLIQQCEIHVRQYLHEVTNLQARITVVDRDFAEYQGQWERSVGEALQHDVAMDVELKRLKKAMQETEMRLGNFDADIQMLQALRKEKVDRHAVNRRVLEIFNHEITASDSISWRCDESREVTNMFGPPRYVLDTNAVLPNISGVPEPWVALVLPQDRADETLQKFRVTNPSSLGEFRELRDNNVLFNSENKYNPRKFIFNVDGCVFKMKIDLEMRFKLYIFTGRRFSGLPQYTKLKADFERPIIELEREIDDCDRKSDARRQLNMQDMAGHAVLRDEIPVAIERLEASRKDLADKRGLTQAEVDRFRKLLQDIEAKLKDLANARIQHIITISNILKQNNIVANLAFLLAQYRAQIEQSLADIGAIRARLTGFEAKIVANIDSRLTM